MTTDIANSLYGYFETLYSVNQRLIKLCGVDVIDNFESSDKEVLNIIQDIPRLIPYYFNKDKKFLELNKRYGLMEYASNIEYLKNDYQKILNDNNNFLDKVRLIRNKYEHQLHDVRHNASGSGSNTLFDFEFTVDDKEIYIDSNEFIELIKPLNVLFSKLAKDISKFAYENGKKDYSYYRRLTKFDFADFNKVYESNILRIFGKTIREF